MLDLFESIKLEDVEKIVFETVKKLTGNKVDFQGNIAKYSVAAEEAAETLEAAAVLMYVIADSSRDGLHSRSEIRAIVNQAKTLTDALREVADAFVKPSVEPEDELEFAPPEPEAA